MLSSITAVAGAQTSLTAFEQQAVLAFNPNGQTFSSVTLNGSVVWTAGSLQESGTVVLKAGADGSTSETWTLPSQSHARTEASWSAGRSCSFTDPKGVAHTDTDPNCRRAVSWFAPWSGLTLVSGGTLLGTDATQAADLANGIAVLALRTNDYSSRPQSSVSATLLALLEARAATTVTFNRVSALPMAVDFDQILDNDPSHTIKYQTIFSDYRNESGLMVPHRIQRYIQRTLQADITITSVTVQ